MYQVILVDDDVAVLEFLKQLVPWNELGFQLAGAFTSATEAMETCAGSHPDLIITDIGMPGLDGLTFIRQLQRAAAKTRFVILSCHDEFHYAQQAVQLGVQDYILKETLNLAGMREILERVKVKMEEDHRLQLQVDRLHYQANINKSAFKEKWLRDLLSGPVIDDKTLLEPLREFGLNTGLGHFIPAVCRLNSLQDAMTRYEKEDMVKFIAENAAEELLRDEPDVMFFGYSAKEFFLVCTFRKELTTNPYDKLVKVCGMLQRAFAKYLKLDYSMVLGEAVSDGASLKRQLPSLLSAADLFFYEVRPAILKIKDVPVWPPQEDMYPYFFELTESLNRLLLDGSGETQIAVDSFVAAIRKEKFRPADVKQLVWKAALDLQMKLKFSLAYDKKKVQQTIEQMMNVSELRDWLIRFMKEAVMQAEQIAKESKKTEIVDAQKYVRQHLDRKITLEEVAAQLHLNPSYFSRLFKKETGENFIEFVTRTKMEKARELLSQSGKTVEQVAFKLGYDNKSYFIKLFKQHFGISPGKFV